MLVKLVALGRWGIGWEGVIRIYNRPPSEVTGAMGEVHRAGEERGLNLLEDLVKVPDWGSLGHGGEGMFAVEVYRVRCTCVSNYFGAPHAGLEIGGVVDNSIRQYLGEVRCLGRGVTGRSEPVDVWAGEVPGPCGRVGSGLVAANDGPVARLVIVKVRLEACWLAIK